MPAHMPISDWHRTEWLRLASDAAKRKRPSVAERYRLHANGPSELPLDVYDRLMRFYRGWLIQGFPSD